MTRAAVVVGICENITVKTANRSQLNSQKDFIYGTKMHIFRLSGLELTKSRRVCEKSLSYCKIEHFVYLKKKSLHYNSINLFIKFAH